MTLHELGQILLDADDGDTQVFTADANYRLRPPVVLKESSYIDGEIIDVYVIY